MKIKLYGGGGGGGVKSCLGSDSKMESTPPVTSNFYETLQGVSGVSLYMFKEFSRYLLSTLRYGSFSCFPR